MGHVSLGSSMNNSVHLAPRYEALFRISDCHRVHRNIEGLFRVLPLQLQPVLDFNYMSAFLNSKSADEASWYVPDDDNRSAVTVARDVPSEQAHGSWAFEHQQPAIIRKVDHEGRFTGSRQSLTEQGFQSGCAVPITTEHRRLGAMFLGRERPCPCSDEERRGAELQ